MFKLFEKHLFKLCILICFLGTFKIVLLLLNILGNYSLNELFT